MAEVATIVELNGPSGTKTSLASKVARFCNADDPEPVLNYPCKIPASGFSYSFRKTHCLRITGDFNQVSDIYVYGDGTFAADWSLDAANGGALRIGHRDEGDNGLPIDVTLHGTNEYAQAAGDSTSGHAIDDPVNGHPYYMNQSTPVLNFDTCLANSPCKIDGGPYTEDFYSKAWVMDLKIPPSAAYGAKSPKSITVIYNIF